MGVKGTAEAHKLHCSSFQICLCPRRNLAPSMVALNLWLEGRKAERLSEVLDFVFHRKVAKRCFAWGFSSRTKARKGPRLNLLCTIFYLVVGR